MSRVAKLDGDKCLHGAGGRTIAESAETAVVFGMPHVLSEWRRATLVSPCNSIAAQLRDWLA
jgi:two-component system chemotaxis response regulator CheB